MLIRFCALALMLTVSAYAHSQVSFGSGAGRWFYGAGFGATFGDVTSVSATPYVGYRLTDQFSLGTTGTLRYRNDDRAARDISTVDYGAGVFGRYYFAQYFFAQAEYNYLSYQFVRGDNNKDRRGVSSVLGGGGVAYPLNNNVTASITALYNFSYGGYSSPAPYASPWVIRFGIGVGF